MPDTAVQTPPKQARPRPRPQEKPEPERPRLWNVVILNDDDHTFEYVIEMVQALFGHDEVKAAKIAQTVDKDGRAVCLTTHREHAELKRDQVHAYGPDKYSSTAVGAMSAIIEPAEFGGDDEGPDDRT